MRVHIFLGVGGEKRYTIVGGDICGIRDVNHEPTLNVIAVIFEKLRYCMEKSFSDSGPGELSPNDVRREGLPFHC